MTKYLHSVLNTLSVIDAIRPNESVGVTELSRRVNLPKATVQLILVTLHSAGWLAKSAPPTRWRPADKLFGLGGRFYQSWDLRTVALPLMEELRNRTEESVNLILQQTRYIVVVERVNSLLPITVSGSVGTVTPIQATASGKAILAKLSDQEIMELIGAEGERCNENTIVDTSKLLVELSEVRKRGYAVSWQEWKHGIVAVGAAITDGMNRPIAAVSVAGPNMRMSPKRTKEIGPLAMQTAANISSRLSGMS